MTEAAENAAVYARRIMTLERGYDELRTINNRLQAENDRLRSQVEQQLRDWAAECDKLKAEIARFAEHMRVLINDHVMQEAKLLARVKTAEADNARLGVLLAEVTEAVRPSWELSPEGRAYYPRRVLSPEGRAYLAKIDKARKP